jgi:hypothetical protein
VHQDLVGIPQPEPLQPGEEAVDVPAPAVEADHQLVAARSQRPQVVA